MNSSTDPHSLRIIRQNDGSSDKVFDALTKPDDLRVRWRDFVPDRRGPGS
jgi:hypothetical protein